MTIAELIQILNDYGIYSVSYDNYTTITKYIVISTLDEAYNTCSREEFSTSDYIFLCELTCHCIDFN